MRRFLILRCRRGRGWDENGEFGGTCLLCKLLWIFFEAGLLSGWHRSRLNVLALQVAMNSVGSMFALQASMKLDVTNHGSRYIEARIHDLLNRGDSSVAQVSMIMEDEYCRL